MSKTKLPLLYILSLLLLTCVSADAADTMTKTWTDGAEYVGQCLGDMRDGQGMMTWANGTKYVGQWLSDKMDGQGVMTSLDGEK